MLSVWKHHRVVIYPAGIQMCLLRQAQLRCRVMPAVALLLLCAGWFQSSLLTAVAATGSAPYKQVRPRGHVPCTAGGLGGGPSAPSAEAQHKLRTVTVLSCSTVFSIVTFALHLPLSDRTSGIQPCNVIPATCSTAKSQLPSVSVLLLVTHCQS